MSEQPLEVLACSYQEGLRVDQPQPAQAKTARAVPLFGLGKQWFDPDLALPQRLLVRRGRLVVDLGGVKIQLAAPNEPCLLALLDDGIEEATKDLQPVA